MAKTFKTISDLIANAFIRDEKTPVNAYNKLMGQGVKHTRSQKLNGGRMANSYEGDKDIYKQEVQFTRQGVAKDTNPDYRSVDSNLVLFNIDKYFNNLIEEINKNLELYLSGKIEKNSGKVIFYWNELVYYLNRFLPTNLSNKDTNTIKLKFDELLPSVEQLDAIANKENFLDKSEINQLMTTIESKNYKAIKTKYSERLSTKDTMYKFKNDVLSNIRKILSISGLSLEDKQHIHEYANQIDTLLEQYLKSADERKGVIIKEDIKALVRDVEHIVGIDEPIVEIPQAEKQPINIIKKHIKYNITPYIDDKLITFPNRKQLKANIAEINKLIKQYAKNKGRKEKRQEIFNQIILYKEHCDQIIGESGIALPVEHAEDVDVLHDLPPLEEDLAAIQGEEGDGRRRRKLNKKAPARKQHYHENKDVLFPSYDFYDMAKMHDMEKQKRKKK